ncbi:hypothetical protein JXC34_03775 [Candidatus Woesearchaeota archaeon]|nr:hypothetical protein [Candidatus Woesearchaeota archaeon]
MSGIVPLAPDTLNVGSSDTQNASGNPARNHTAYAGNLTGLEIWVQAQTKHWQGYYGNITGTIVLDDAADWTLYDWPSPEPKGEIYAVVNATTPSWATATCFNVTQNDPNQRYSGILGYWEQFYNMTWNNVDGINETFNSSTEHEAFDIGDVNTIGSGAENCPHTYMHMNDAYQEDKFLEVLLQDEDDRIIYVGIIENDDDANNTDIQGYTGYQFTPDFQMLVAEDGTSRSAGTINTDTTTYYFYLDIE